MFKCVAMQVNKEVSTMTVDSANAQCISYDGFQNQTTHKQFATCKSCMNKDSFGKKNKIVFEQSEIQ